jgi:uracil-DNA glycosylase family 4
MPTYEAVLPPEVVQGKKGRGRPSVKGIGPTPLYKFPGPTQIEKLHQLSRDWHACRRCFLGEYKGNLRCDDDIVFGSGNEDASVLIVGEAPGDEEEREKYPFLGPAGQTLNQLLAKVSDAPEIQNIFAWYSSAPRTPENAATFHSKVNEWRDQEFFITNVVGCQPPENRAPTLPEMKACWERLWNIIYIVDPDIIIAVGNTALSTVTRKLSAQITTVRGSVFDVTYDGMVGKLTYPVIPILHPSFLSRVSDWKRSDGYYAKTVEDLRKAMRISDFIKNKNYGTPIPQRCM